MLGCPPGRFRAVFSLFSLRLHLRCPMPARPYTLLIATGQSPQVVTETIFELHRTDALQPASVHVVTTRVGRVFGEALLQGKERTDPIRGDRIENARDRWTPFCDEVLGRDPVDLHFHVPEVQDQALEDIRRCGDDTRFSSICYTLVEELTREDELPLVGSIAGGRKTMSAHMMTAFSVYARSDDRLTHVLLTDPDLEYDADFFYPESGSPGYGQLLDLVDVRFPRLRPVLQSGLLDELPEARADLSAILDALEPYNVSPRAVRQIDLELRDHGARLVFLGDEDELAICELTPKQASTLAVFIELRAQSDGPVPALHFIDNDTVEKQRAAVASLCTKNSFTEWTSTDDVSKAFSDVNRALRSVVLAERLIQIEGLSTEPREYDWPEPPPSLTARSARPNELWPFSEELPLKRLQ
jgi:CRISPR-associated protein (TIGR02584 family)